MNESDAKQKLEEIVQEKLRQIKGGLREVKEGMWPDHCLYLDDNSWKIIEKKSAPLQPHHTLRLAVAALEPGSIITELGLSGRKIGEQGGIRLSQSLRFDKTLTHLDVSGCAPGDTGAIAIIESVGESNTIIDLDLSDNDLTDEVAFALAKMLQKNTSIQRLFIGNNKISNAGINKILEVLEIHNRSLAIFDFNNNAATGDIMPQLKNTLYANSHLVEINCHHNDPTTNQGRNDMYNMMSETPSLNLLAVIGMNAELDMQYENNRNDALVLCDKMQRLRKPHNLENNVHYLTGHAPTGQQHNPRGNDTLYGEGYVLTRNDAMAIRDRLPLIIVSLLEYAFDNRSIASAEQTAEILANTSKAAADLGIDINLPLYWKKLAAQISEPRLYPGNIISDAKGNSNLRTDQDIGRD